MADVWVSSTQARTYHDIGAEKVKTRCGGYAIAKGRVVSVRWALTAGLRKCRVCRDGRIPPRVVPSRDRRG